MKIKIKVLLVPLLLTACSNLPENGIPKKKPLEIDGKTREYILYIPKGIPPGSPLVVALHGYTDNDSSFMRYTGLNEVADKYRFAVCYPQGLADSSGKTFWQVGYSFHRKEKVDDVKFITLLTHNLQKEYGFDPGKTFVTGMSNGGDMCILLACKKPQLFKAVAPVVGCMMKINFDSCRSTLPIPVLMINGTADRITWWNGDLSDSQHYGPYLPVEMTFKFFADKNKCTDVAIDTIPDIVISDSSYVVLKKYSEGVDGNQVWLYSVINGGHDWIGKSGNMDLNAGEEIWKFFSLFISSPAE